MLGVTWWLDGTLLLGYVSIALIVGWYNSRDSITSLDEYAVGYTSISTPVLICGILATGIGAGTVIGEVGQLFALGLPFALTLISRVLSYFIASKIFSKHLDGFKHCHSISHVMRELYGGGARAITTIMALLMGLGLIAAQTIAVAMVLNNLLSLSHGVAIIISFLMITIFSLMGGVRTIVQIGVFQFILFFLVLPISCAAVSSAYGGYAELSRSLTIPNWGFGNTDKWILMALFLSGLLPDCSSSFIQKCLIARNKKQLEDSLQTVAKIHIPIILSLCFIAYAVKVVNPGLDPSQTMFYYINHMAPVLLKGVLSVGLIAIIMGMSDGILHATSTIVANDVVKVLRPNSSDNLLLLCARWSIVLLCIAAMGLTFFSEDILSIIYATYSFWHPIIMVPICAGFLGFKAAPKAFLISAISAACVVLVGYYIELPLVMIPIMGAIGSFIGFFVGHFFLRLYDAHMSYSDYLNVINGVRHNWRKSLIMRIAVLKEMIKETDLFPRESQMELGQRQMYHKFCVSMVVCFFVYAMTMGRGPQYDILVFLISMGYIMGAAIMIRNVLFRGVSSGQDNNYLHWLWYSSLIMLPVVASYALLSRQAGSDIVLITAALSLIALGLFTNIATFIACLCMGSFIGVMIYHYYFNISALDNALLFNFIYAWVGAAAIGLYFLWARERATADEVGRMRVVGGSMAHEVKTPMAVNYTYAATALAIFSDGKVKKSKNHTVSVEFPEQEFKDLNQFMNKMVELSAAGAKTVDMLLISMRKDMNGVTTAEFNLLDSVQNGVNAYVASHSAVASQIDVKVAKSFKVMGAKDYMSNVIHNLVKNAFNHGGRSVQVKIYSKNSNTLIVEDNGRGIPADVLPLIFGRFYTKSQDGTGLGLAFTRMVIKDMGGAITCESEEGKYTRFIITLPTL